MIVNSIWAKMDDKIASLAMEVRKFILRELKNIEEYPDDKLPIIGYGYGGGYKNLICTILLSKKSVKLAFYKGSELPDPEMLLTGKGKVHRYVEIKSVNHLQSSALKSLMKEGYKAHQLRKKNSQS